MANEDTELHNGEQRQKETGHSSFHGVWRLDWGPMTWINLSWMILTKLGIWWLFQRWGEGYMSWFIQRSAPLSFDWREILMQLGGSEFRWDWSDSYGAIFHKFCHFSALFQGNFCSPSISLRVLGVNTQSLARIQLWGKNKVLKSRINIEFWE